MAITSKWAGRKAGKAAATASKGTTTRTGRGQTQSARDAYRSAVKNAAAGARRKGANKMPDWRLRMDMSWYPRADPGETKRKDDLTEAEYGPKALKIIQQPSLRDPDELVPAFKVHTCWVDGRKVFSNSWNGERPEPDAPFPDLLDLAYKYAMEAGDEETASKFYSRPSYVVKAVLLDPVHLVEVTKGQRTYTNYVQCDGEDHAGNSACHLCQDKVPVQNGRVVFWELNESQWESLRQDVENAGDICANCGEGKIIIEQFCCAGCDVILFDNGEDAEKEFNFTDKDEATFLTEPYECPECGHTDLLEPALSCIRQKGYGPNKRWVPGCDTPTLLDDPWEQVIVIEAEKSGRSTDIKVVAMEPLEENWREGLNFSEQRYEMPTERFYGFEDMKAQYNALKKYLPPESQLPVPLEELQKILEADWAEYKRELAEGAYDAVDEDEVEEEE